MTVEDWLITGVQTSCPCLKAKPEENSIAPGQSVKVEVSLQMPSATRVLQEVVVRLKNGKNEEAEARLRVIARREAGIRLLTPYIYHASRSPPERILIRLGIEAPAEWRQKLVMINAVEVVGSGGRSIPEFLHGSLDARNTPIGVEVDWRIQAIVPVGHAWSKTYCYPAIQGRGRLEGVRPFVIEIDSFAEHAISPERLVVSPPATVRFYKRKPLEVLVIQEGNEFTQDQSVIEVQVASGEPGLRRLTVTFQEGGAVRYQEIPIYALQ